MRYLGLLFSLIVFSSVCVSAQEVGRDSINIPTRHSHPTPYNSYEISDPLFPAPSHTLYDRWDVHEGVNVRMEMSATVGIGRHSPDGVGFGRTIDFLYVSPIRNKWNYSIGATTRGFNWGAIRYNDIGINGTVNYYPSDKVSLSLTGYKSLLPNSYGTLPCLRGHLDSYLGGDLNVKLSRNSFFELHVGTGSWSN